MNILSDSRLSNVQHTRFRVAGAALACLIGIFAVPSARADGLVGARAAAVSMPPAVVEATAAHVESDATTTKVVFDLSAQVVPSTFVLTDPNRAIVDLPQTDFKFDAAVGKPAVSRDRRAKRLINSFRFGLLSPGRSRIVIDLAVPAKIAAASVQKVGDYYQLVVALTRIDRAAFRAAARDGKGVPTAAVEPTLVSDPSTKPTIVLDPGHGGPDTGASVKGVLEKDVALAFAKMLAAKLESTGSFNVVMTRSNDVFIPLSERVRVARGVNAALMVSIHADTLAEAGDVGGATVYTVSDKASDAYAAKVAAKENAADATVGLAGQPDAADVNDILFDLTRQETRAYSHVFARTLVNYWRVVGRLNKNPQRAAGFVVLKAPDVPSILLELGYLSNPDDSSALTSDTWRDHATTRMAEAIEAYFADRQGPAKAAAGVPLALRQ